MASVLEDSPTENVPQEVRITRGPFSGSVGRVLKVKGRDRLVLSIVLSGRPVAVEIDRRWVALFPAQ